LAKSMLGLAFFAKIMYMKSVYIIISCHIFI